MHASTMHASTMHAPRQPHHARAVLRALALVIILIAAVPASTARAAAQPDFMTVLQAASWNASKGQTFSFVAFYKRKTAANGPAKTTIYLQKGFGTPTITHAVGFSCSKSYKSSGWFPGWYVTCTKPSITPGGAWFDAVQIQTTAPTTSGNYFITSQISPTSGTDLDPSDNHDQRTLHVN